ncbi:MAG: aldehyde dehydrogenase family protein, partial [Pseudomonadota bacterium]
ALEREVFGPVLHLAPYRAQDLDRVIDAVNAKGYGLTFGMHSRIDDRVAQVAERLRCGNIYVNRNQIGAVVGSQPFGGEGLSGTGPKAGGPGYLPRFCRMEAGEAVAASGARLDVAVVQARIDALGVSQTALATHDMPGPTGESNRLSVHPIGPTLCLGPGMADALEQMAQVVAVGGQALAIAPGLTEAQGLDGVLASADLAALSGFGAVACWGPAEHLREVRQALAAREGPILPLLTAATLKDRLTFERHISIDTTAAGGNAALLASMC